MPERSKTPGDPPAEEAAELPRPQGRPEACPVAFCPVSMFLTATGSVQPEVVEHLLAAGRELLLAAKAVVDARAAGMARTSPLERIEIG
jgi:hypothetical protein